MGTTGKRLVVLGGGLSGLSFVHYLRNFALAFKKTDLISQIIVVEADKQMGGSIKSIVFEDNIVHELGIRNFRTKGPQCKNFGALVGHLGLADLIYPVRADWLAKRNLFIYDDKQLFQMPKSAAKIFAKIPNTNSRVFSAYWQDLVRAKRLDLTDYPDQDPPLYDFIKHRFGEPVADKIGDPIISMLLCGDIRKLSTRALVGEFLDSEQYYNSVLKGLIQAPIKKQKVDELFYNDLFESELVSEMHKKDITTFSFKPGNQVVADRLCATLLGTNEDRKVSIYNETEAIAIRFNSDGAQPTDWSSSDGPQAPCSVLVRTVDGENVKIDCDHLISALPSSRLASLLEGSMPTNCMGLLEELQSIEQVPVASACLEFRDLKPDEVGGQVLNSSGVAINTKSDCRLLSLYQDINKLCPESAESKLGVTKMYCNIGGAFYEKAFGSTEPDQVTPGQIEQIAIEEACKLMKTRRRPTRISSRMLLHGPTQCRPGHKARVERMRASLEANAIPLSLIGLAYDGITPSEGAFGARLGADRLLKQLEQPLGRPGRRELGQAASQQQLAGDDQSRKAILA